MSKASATISGFSIASKTYGDSSFEIIPPTSDSEGSFTYTSNSDVVTISGNIITINKGGDAIITATQSETTNYMSNTISTTFQVNKKLPTITNFSIAPKGVMEGSFTITPPTSNSTGNFSYTSSNESVSTVSGNQITIHGIGSSTITATQEQSNNYTQGAITTLFQVNSKPTPTISLSIPSKKIGEVAFGLQPTSNSTGSFTYESLDTNIATISGNVVTIVGVGNVNVRVNQEGSPEYNSGTITVPFEVIKGDSNIDLSISSKTYGDGPFTLNPTSNGNGDFSYTIEDTTVATISGNTVTIVGAGNTNIIINQKETNTYKAGTKTIVLQINKKTPTIQLSVPSKPFGSAPFDINPTSDSKGVFSYTIADNNVATITGNTITIAAVGNTNIIVTQPETNNYTSGTLTLPFDVSKANPTIDFKITKKAFGSSPFTIPSPTSNSTGEFSYTSSNTAVATVSDNQIAIHGTGTSTITVTQAETFNYYSATQTTTFEVFLMPAKDVNGYLIVSSFSPYSQSGIKVKWDWDSTIVPISLLSGFSVKTYANGALQKTDEVSTSIRSISLSLSEVSEQVSYTFVVTANYTAGYLAVSDISPSTMYTEGITYQLDGSGLLISGVTVSVASNYNYLVYNDTLYPVVGMTPTAFRGSPIANISLSTNITSIPDGAFADCPNLTNVEIPPSVLDIGPGALSGCISLEEVSIPDSVASIGPGAFSGCLALANVAIPNSVTSIGPGALSGCDSLSNLSLPLAILASSNLNNVTPVSNVQMPVTLSIIDGKMVLCRSTTDGNIELLKIENGKLLTIKATQ